MLSKVLSLDKLSCPQIWNIEQEKDREKEKVGGRPTKLNEKKGDRDLEREIKNKGDIFLLEEQHENFVAAVTKWEMLAAANQMQGENERQWKKVNENTYDISSIKRVTKKFWKFHVVVVQNNGKEMYKKIVLYVQSCFFAN